MVSRALSLLTGVLAGVTVVVTSRRARRDVSQAEAARRYEALENARLAAIVAASQDAIISKTPDGIVKTWNPGAERLYGYTAEEMIGHDVTRLLPPDRPGEERELLARVRRGQALTRYETRRMRKDGTVIEVEVDSVCLHGDTPGSVEHATRVRAALADAGVPVARFVLR